MTPAYQRNNATIYQGDCLPTMTNMPACSVDSIITDSPYGLSFMGKQWDHGLPGVPFWSAALRVAKPGAVLMAFGGTRTFHRLACAIEDAGWEIRDTVMWVYASGFPKSLDISKAIDKAAGAEREVVGVSEHGACNKPHGNSFDDDGYEWQRFHNLTAPATDAAKQWQGWGSALKPAWEPIIVAMKPLDGTFAANAQKWGVAGLNIDGGRVDIPIGDKKGEGGDDFSGATSAIGYNGGWGAQTTRDLTSGRWPANLIHDGSDEVVGEFPDVNVNTPGQLCKGETSGYDGGWGDRKPFGYDNSGSAARFFYCAKASTDERWCGCSICGAVFPSAECGKHKHGKASDDQKHIVAHPTVKPIALMRYLCKLTATPTGGTVLDPFAGSGSTLVAAIKEGRKCIGIEQDQGYFDIAVKRITAAFDDQGLFRQGESSNPTPTPDNA